MFSKINHVAIVSDIGAFQQDVDKIADDNPHLAPEPLGKSPEGKALEELCRRSYPFGDHWMADSDGVLLNVRAN